MLVIEKSDGINCSIAGAGVSLASDFAQGRKISGRLPLSNLETRSPMVEWRWMNG